MWAFAQMTTLTAGILSYPLDTIRVRRIMDAGRENKMYGNSVDCFKKILQKEGPRGLFKGMAINLISGTGGAFLLVFYDKL